MLASAAAVIQGYLRNTSRPTLNSFQMRDVLRSTGTPQIGRNRGMTHHTPELVPQSFCRYARDDDRSETTDRVRVWVARYAGACSENLVSATRTYSHGNVLLFNATLLTLTQEQCCLYPYNTIHSSVLSSEVVPMSTSTPHSRRRSSRASDQVKRLENSTLARTFTRGSRKNKVRKEFWLDPKLLQTVKEELGVATEREAVEMALDLVVFRKELAEGARRLVGTRITLLDE